MKNPTRNAKKSSFYKYYHFQIPNRPKDVQQQASEMQYQLFKAKFTMKVNRATPCLTFSLSWPIEKIEMQKYIIFTCNLLFVSYSLLIYLLVNV